MDARFSCRSFLTFALCLTWLIGTVAGLCHVLTQDGRLGAAAAAPAQWPTGIARSNAPYSLVMVVHPHCPCSRASVAELAQLMARSEGRVHATVLFVRYAGFSPEWAHTDLWRQAASIPGVQVVTDGNGVLARQFGARTSGQTYVFDRSGRLLFQGGLTGARGHEGDNANLNAALAVLHKPTPHLFHAAVYGCSLFGLMSAGEAPPTGNKHLCHP